MNASRTPVENRALVLSTVGRIESAERCTSVHVVEIPREGTRPSQRQRVEIQYGRRGGPTMWQTMPVHVALELVEHLRAAVAEIQAAEQADRPESRPGARADLRVPRRPDPLHTRGGR